ncbi:MAG: MerR family transcriptional regulator [Pseudomonas sp.]
MNIGVAASESGLSAKRIRYYERIDLIPPSGRTQAGYRVYRENDIQVFRFIHHARNLGFSVEQVRALLALCSDDEVRAIARSYIDALNARIALLEAMRDALSYPAEHCDDMELPTGPLLDDLAPTPLTA